MSEVRLENLTKRFKDTVAVDNISLTIEEGEFFSLLGPSGCGKTTTLRMIGGFETPSDGHVYLGDSDVTDLPPYKRNVNTVFQSYALFPHLTVFENIAYGLKRKNVEKSEIGSRVKDIMKLVDIEGYGDRKSTQLSGGQQQRVALARALVNKPSVLLLDEPLGALDLKLRKQLQIELKRIQSEIGITFVYVTHDQEEAMTMSNRIAVMNGGHFEQIGAPQDVYELPATEFVAGFLGASNLLEGRVENADGTMTRVGLSAGGTVSLPSSRVPEGNGEVRIGVRPEKIEIKPQSHASNGRQNSIPAKIMISTYTGVSTAYECRAQDGSKVVVFVQNLGTDIESLGAGTDVLLNWDPDHTFAVSKGAEAAAPADKEE